MSKPKKRKKRPSGRKGASPISSHARQGKKLTPPLAGLPNMKAVSWLPDVFPDMLWLCSLVSEDPDDGMRAATAALNLISEAVSEAEGSELVVDGTLTSLESVAEPARALAVQRLQAEGGYEVAVPEGFAHGLGMYEGAPGSWLIRPWRDRGLSVDPEAAQRYLAPVITDAAHGQSEIATRAKFLVVARWANAGKLHVPPDSTFKLFPRYPDGLDDDERRLVEASTRALFGVLFGAIEGTQEAREEWARTFWRSNWERYLCLNPQPDAEPNGDAGELAPILQGAKEQAELLYTRFVELASASDPDLYAPDRHEVLTGIVAAALRAATAAARTPLLWSSEHGMPMLRGLLEALIVLRWLLLKQDPDLYVRFKDYGRGRLKLLKLHVDEYLNSLDEPPEDLVAYADLLEAEVNQDLWEEWQEISLEGTFSGKNLRVMAVAVGMQNEHRFLFAPASAATHGEWTVLDRYALVRCQNPLHRWHRIPRKDLSVTLGTELIQIAIGVAEDLLVEYERAVTPTPPGGD